MRPKDLYRKSPRSQRLTSLDAREEAETLWKQTLDSPTSPEYTGKFAHHTEMNNNCRLEVDTTQNISLDHDVTKRGKENRSTFGEMVHILYLKREVTQVHAGSGEFTSAAGSYLFT